MSYSWRNDKPDEEVLSLVSTLRENGFDARCDVMFAQETTSISFPEMMAKNMSDAEKVVIVLSEGYKRKADGFCGGVGEEYRFILSDIAHNEGKYILVSFSTDIEMITPHFLSGREVIILDSSGSSGYTKLFHRIDNIPEYSFPKINKKPLLEPRVVSPIRIRADYADYQPINKESSHKPADNPLKAIPSWIYSILVFVISYLFIGSEIGYYFSDWLIRITNFKMGNDRVQFYLQILIGICALLSALPFSKLKRYTRSHRRVTTVIALVCLIAGSVMLIDVSYNYNLFSDFENQDIIGFMSLVFFSITFLQFFQLYQTRTKSNRPPEINLNSVDKIYEYQEGTTVP